MDLVRAGNDRAFEAIVLRYHRPLLRHCRRLLPAGRAEDAVQQALLRALEAMRADDRELQLGPWLHRIAHNTAIDSLRRLDSHWEELDERMDGVEPTHAAVERRARFSSVVSNMGSLPERQRRALVLREFEGRSYEEISRDTRGERRRRAPAPEPRAKHDARRRQRARAARPGRPHRWEARPA